MRKRYYSSENSRKRKQRLGSITTPHNKLPHTPRYQGICGTHSRTSNTSLWGYHTRKRRYLLSVIYHIYLPRNTSKSRIEGVRKTTYFSRWIRTIPPPPPPCYRHWTPSFRRHHFPEDPQNRAFILPPYMYGRCTSKAITRTRSIGLEEAQCDKGAYGWWYPRRHKGRYWRWSCWHWCIIIIVTSYFLLCLYVWIGWWFNLNYEQILSPGDKNHPESVKIKNALVGAGASKVIETMSDLLSICARTTTQ